MHIHVKERDRYISRKPQPLPLIKKIHINVSILKNKLPAFVTYILIGKTQSLPYKSQIIYFTNVLSTTT